MRTTLLRPLFVLALIAGSQFSGFAQAPLPDCDNCPCPIPAILGTTISNNPGIAAGVTQTFNNVPFANAPAGTYARFYAWAGSSYLITVCTETHNTMMYLTNPSMGKVACDDDGCGDPDGPSSASFIATQTGLYRIYMFNGDCPNTFPVTTNMAVTITRTLPAVPANNLPCDAEPLVVAGNDCNFLPATNSGATNSATGMPAGALPIPGCLFQGADVWYSAIIPPSGLLAIETNGSSLCSPAFAIYTTANCTSGPFTQLGGTCYDNGNTGPGTDAATVFNAAANGLNPGDQVLIRLWERNGNENGSFEICAYEALPPPNDEPCAAIPLDVNTSCEPTTYTFANATPLSTVTAPDPTCGGANFTAYPGDVWFSFQVPSPLPIPWSGISVNTIAGSQDNMAMAWYRLTGDLCTAPYGSMTQIACNVNQTGANLMPRLSMTALNEGETIYVRLWGENPYIGTYQICAMVNQTPVNDDPCGALPLNLEYGCVLMNFSNESATQTGNTGAGNLPPGVAALNNPTCGGAPSSDVWFTVTVPPNGVVQFDTQAGSMNDAAMAVYSVSSGTCAANNMVLQQVGCAVGGSGQGSPAMPYLNITGQVPGATLYVRIWRQNGTNGTFGLCAKRTDPPDTDCYYTLTLNDTGGDGWGGSYVEVCIGGACTPYTVNGSNASVNIGVNIGQTFTVSYTAAGGFQNQNSFVLSQYGGPVYVSGTSPANGMHYSVLEECDPPPAPQSDCIGAHTICDANQFVSANPSNTGGVDDLNSPNWGCLGSSGGERQGLWFKFHIAETSAPGANLAFHIVPQTGTGNGGFTIFDFAVWGPYYNPPGSGPAGSWNWSSLGTVCPPQGPPHRCNWYSFSGTKGLAYNNALPTTAGGGGPQFVRHLTTQPGQVYILYVDNWGMNGMQFAIQWQTPPPAYQPMADISCIVTVPVEMVAFDAQANAKQVDVTWSTASESGTSHYIVERSGDGEVFENVGRVEAAGNTAHMTDYLFVDDAPLPGLSYYRLRQVDENGNSMATHAIPVMFKGGRLDLDVFPNPADETLWLAFDTDRDEQLIWRISDASGRRVNEEQFAANSGRNIRELPVSKLDQGSYIIELVRKDGGTLGISRFVKQ